MDLHNMRRQQHLQASNSTGSQTFWTICPTCGTKYQHYLSILKKPIRCLYCFKAFIAHDLIEQPVPSGANQQSAGVCKNAGVFEELRLLQRFEPGQVWALYSDLDKFPNYYAFIEKVDLKNIEVQARWLEIRPEGEEEKRLVGEDRTVGCGTFRFSSIRGIMTYNDTKPFSHPVHAIFTGRRNSYEIYPRKGEVWALIKGWDIGWGSDAGNQKNYKYEVVQVLSDFTTGTSIIVTPLVKIKVFVNLFMQSKEAAPYFIPQDDTVWFSHCIPYLLMNGTESEGVPEGALELDPAALPLNLEQAFASVVPESSSVKGHEFAKYAGSSSGNYSCKGSMGVGEKQHATCMNSGIFTKARKEENREHDTPSAVEVTDVDEESDGIIHSEVECPEPEFYEFSEIRLLHKFEPGQIWALYSDIDKFPNYYAFIKNVDLKNNKVQIRWLDVCPQGEEEKRLVKEDLTVGCGTFRVSSGQGTMTYTGTESFSHPVHTRSTGRRNEYEIIPCLREIWAVYKNWRAGWTTQDFQKCGYELVEIFGHTDSSIQVQLLRKVDGYRAVFRREEAVKTISKDEYPKFSHQIPCFHLTNEKGGKLRGYLELDPYSVPEEFLSTDSI